MGHGETGEGDEILDGLYSRFRSSYLSERGHPGPTTQLRPLHGHEVSAQRLPEGSLILSWAQDTPPSLSARTSDEDTGNNFSRSLGVPYQSRTNERGIKTRGFPSRRGDSCMIVYMSPLRSNSTFFLYSPTIQLEKNASHKLLFFIK